MAKSKLYYSKGSYVLAENVADTHGYYDEHKGAIDKIVAWGNEVNVYVGFGTSSDHTYLCEYEITGETKTKRRSLVAELKAMLKQEWKRMRLGHQQDGYYF